MQTLSCAVAIRSSTPLLVPSLIATVGLWVSVSHDQALFQTYAMTMGHSERSVLPESTICMIIPPAVGSSVECISFRAIAVLSRPPAPHT